MFHVSKRDRWMGWALVLAVAVLTGCSSTAVPRHDGSQPFQKIVNPGNAALYTQDQAFDGDAALDAYYSMMRGFGYPIPAVLKTDSLWVCDFMQRDFENLGMGGIFWANVSDQYGTVGTAAYKGDYKDQRYGYLGHEIYLLPGQMLPEHRHIGGVEGHGPKMEAWHIRHGSVQFFGEYEGDGGEKPIEEMPAADRPWGYGEDWFKSKYYADRSAGEMYQLNDPESWHFQRAGPNGAIVSEYATYHNHVEFSKPGMEFASSEAKQ